MTKKKSQNRLLPCVQFTIHVSEPILQIFRFFCSQMQSMTDQVEEGNRIKERIPLLEEQLKVYQNDFESER